MCLRPPHSPTPETQIIDIQSLGIVQEALARLEPRKRDALLLSRLERLTHKEIAARLSVSPRTVRTDIKEAMAAITRSLMRNSNPNQST